MRKDLGRSDALWNEKPSMGEEGFIATIKDKEELVKALSNMLGRRRKTMGN